MRAFIARAGQLYTKYNYAQHNMLSHTNAAHMRLHSHAHACGGRMACLVRAHHQRASESCCIFCEAYIIVYMCASICVIIMWCRPTDHSQRTAAILKIDLQHNNMRKWMSVGPTMGPTHSKHICANQSRKCATKQSHTSFRRVCLEYTHRQWLGKENPHTPAYKTFGNCL